MRTPASIAMTWLQIFEYFKIQMQNTRKFRSEQNIKIASLPRYQNVTTRVDIFEIRCESDFSKSEVLKEMHVLYCLMVDIQDVEIAS